MKKTIVIVSIIFVLLAYPYWQIRNLDPEGACKEIQYLSICFDAWEQALYQGRDWHFQKLPSDQYLITNFHNNKESFYKRAEISLKRGLVGGEEFDYWENKIGVSMSRYLTVHNHPPKERSVNDLLKKEKYFPDISFSEYIARPRIKPEDIPLWPHHEFVHSSTKYIRGVEHGDLSFYGRYKSYLYFPFPPPINNGKLTDNDGAEWKKYKLVENLDGPPWPSDWKDGVCWLRQLDEHWFLALCRDMVGG